MRNVIPEPIRSAQRSEPLLAYETAGSGPSVLMVHGLLSDRRAWTHLTRAVSHRVRTICCDLRGHGGSPRRQPGGPSDHTTDLHALLEALDPGPVHLVGHGAGANLCAALALQVPERVRSLAVIDPVVRRSPLSPAVQEAWHVETILRWLETSHGSVVRRSEHIQAIRKVYEEQTLARLAGPEPHRPEISLAEAPPSPGGVPADPGGLYRLRQPLLIIFAGNEPPETVAMIERLWCGAPHHRMERVNEGRRPLPATAPDALGPLLMAFWQNGSDLLSAGDRPHQSEKSP